MAIQTRPTGEVLKDLFTALTPGSVTSIATTPVPITRNYTNIQATVRELLDNEAEKPPSMVLLALERQEAALEIINRKVNDLSGQIEKLSVDVQNALSYLTGIVGGQQAAITHQHMHPTTAQQIAASGIPYVNPAGQLTFPGPFGNSTLGRGAANPAPPLWDPSPSEGPKSG